jgi:quercetin dioxygenase-like cupin family protein
MIENVINKKNIEPIELLKGIYRKTMLYNDKLMLCHFTLKKEAKLPLHNHKEHQIGYVIKGKLRFITENGEFIANKGDCYIFQSNEKHGAIILEDTEVIDVFNPAREDYK